MSTSAIKLNHLAVVVEDISTALDFWHTALGLPLASVTRDEGEEVDIAFLPLGHSMHDGEIELLAPINDSSGVARYLAKRGAGMHHVCLAVDDLDGTTERLRAHQIELINDTPKQKPDGTRYSFVHPRSTGGVLVELYELPEQK